ncbi:hypothetical protein N9L30_08325 [Burkholderiaceae bacterium]|nr:hypothetical protein [Burkholderiaceae bacterium]
MFKVLLLSTALFLAGCQTLLTSTANPRGINDVVRSGETLASIQSRFGAPVDTQSYQDSIVLTCCEEVLFTNNLLLIWFKNEKVVQTFKTSNTEIGACTNSDTLVDWSTTYRNNALAFVPNNRRASAAAAAAVFINQQQDLNNQMYNSILNNQNSGLATDYWQEHRNGRTIQCRRIGTQVNCQ